MPRPAIKFDKWKAQVAAGSSAEKKPTLRLVEEPGAPKTVEAVEVLAAQEEATPEEDKTLEAGDNLAAGQPEASPMVKKSRKQAREELSGAKGRRKAKIWEVVKDERGGKRAQKLKRRSERQLKDLTQEGVEVEQVEVQPQVEERPEGRISEVRELEPEKTETEAEATEVTEEEQKQGRSGRYLNLAVEGRPTPSGMRYQKSPRKIEGGLRFEPGSNFGGIHVEPRIARSLRVAEKPAAAEPDEILSKEDIIPEIKTSPRAETEQEAIRRKIDALKAEQDELHPDKMAVSTIKNLENKLRKLNKDLGEKEEVEEVEPTELPKTEAPKTPDSFSKESWDLLTIHMSDPEIGKEVWEVLGGMRKLINELKDLETGLVNISGYDKEELKAAKESRMAILRKQIKVKKAELQSFQPKFQELVAKCRAIDLAKEKVTEAEVKGKEEETLGVEDVISEVETPSVTEPITKAVKTLRGMDKPLAEATPAAPEVTPVDESIPEYRSTLLSSKKKGQLESRMSEVKNLPVNEWSETYAEPGGFDQALWDQLSQDKDINEKKQFHELEFNLAEYAIKEVEAQERLKATLYGINARADKLEGGSLTSERRKDLEQEIKELQRAEKVARLEIRGIADLKNKAEAEEKSLLIKAQERAEAARKAALPKTPSVRVAAAPKTPDSATVLERPATPAAPEEFEEEEKLVAGLFEINDKIKQVEKALQAQREVMPRSVLARGMGLEGNEEALKNAERIMQQHKVIRALEDQLSELEEEKEVLMGGKATSTETKTADEAAKTKVKEGKGASKAGRVAKKIAIGTGIGAGGLLVGVGAAFAKLQYWARWQAPLAALEFLMKFTGDPGGMFKKGFDHFEKADPMKLLGKKKTEKAGKE